MSILTPTQRRQFIAEGYVCLSGLIGPEAITATRDALCRALNFTLDDPASWPAEERLFPLDVVELTLPCRTASLNDVSAELVGDMVWPGQCVSPVLENIGRSMHTSCFIPVIAFPRPGEQKFESEGLGGWHVDGMRFSTLWPDQMLLVQFVYLTDTPRYGGATVVRPGSHRQIFEHWVQSGREPGWEEMLPELPFAAPVALEGAAGDVILMHHLLAHTGSPNHAAQPRIALNANATRDRNKTYVRKTGAPDEAWTPLDYTLRTDNLCAVVS